MGISRFAKIDRGRMNNAAKSDSLNCGPARSERPIRVQEFIAIGQDFTDEISFGIPFVCRGSRHSFLIFCHPACARNTPCHSSK